MREVWVALLAWAWMTAASAETLTLDEALATVAAPHPDRRIAESDLAVARADRDQAASLRDFRLYLDGSLATGQGDTGGWRANNIGRIVARKPLFDFGRSGQAIAAANQEVAARQTALFHVQSLRRIDIMARYFDVLLADMQYAADNEFMAVAYVSWDNAQDRF
ncbi:MAG: TolC family protein, partial [Deltaproteobacteria bacterium]|nr:TolC family protein [Deltaproteobacteria bacterium]